MYINYNCQQKKIEKIIFFETNFTNNRFYKYRSQADIFKTT